MKKRIFTLILVSIAYFATAQIGTIENINVSQRGDGSGIVDIEFDLSAVAGSVYNISIEASFDGGETFQIISSDYLGGALEGVSPATGLSIEWDGLSSHPDIYTEEAMIKFIADLVEAGGGDGTVEDYDGNIYPTVIIGEQEWMAENLKVTKYRNGDAIPTGLDNTAWSETTAGAYAIYPHGSISGLNSEAEVLEAYGALYNWYAVDDARGLCPTGWRVATDEDWTELTNYIGGDNIGNKLKSCRQVDSPEGGECDTNVHPRWNSHGTHYGTDEFGLSALPGGFRSSTGYFYYVGYYGCWWSSVEYYDTSAWYRSLYYDNGSVSRYDDGKRFGFSVRCLRD